MFCPEEGADPGSIEKVALHVLSIKLPVPRTTLEKMLTQIKDSLSNLTNIEGIMNHSLQHINKAKELLVQAKDAKYGINVTLKLLNLLSILQDLTKIPLINVVIKHQAHTNHRTSPLKQKTSNSC